MSDENLVEQFQENRPHLLRVAHRILGTASDADDALQEAWLRLSRADTSTIENLPGWLTTVVARICLNTLRSRRVRRDEGYGDPPDLERIQMEHGVDPLDEVLLAESVGAALEIVLETLTPAERTAFVLHDVFAIPFDEVAAIIERSPEATRQLASRARRKVSAGPVSEEQVRVQRSTVEAFFSASRKGDFSGLLALLDPDVVLKADAAAVVMGAADLVIGATDVATTFSGRAKGARVVQVDGLAGAAWSQGGQPRVVFEFQVSDGRVTEIEMVADVEVIAEMDVAHVGAAPETDAQ